MVLKEGMTNTEVAQWQKFLKSQGFTISVDGNFGKISTAVTKEFQKENNLKADGLVGPGTIAVAEKLGFNAGGVMPVTPVAGAGTTSAGGGITSAMLQKIFPATAANLRDRFIAPFNVHLPEFGITSKLEVAAFLATGGIETDYLRTLTEYASGRAYEGRKDLGNVMPGDGMKFKGHGFFQTTGRYNHRRVTQETFAKLGIDFEKEPLRLTEPDIAVESACIFWRDNDLSRWADKGDFFGVSGKVNRGDAKKKALHYDKRLALYNKCMSNLPAKIYE
jgi:predicted chitinase